MSDSSPKLRSPLAAYGPIIAAIGVIVVALGVLFAMGSTKQAAESATPSTAATPAYTGVPEKEMRKRMGYGDPDAARAEALRLMKSRSMSWFDLTRDEQGQLDRLTHGSGRNFFETLVDEERAKTKNLKK